ncbi:MAG TPA: radical SAM protein [candidate division Zixibacteria bacterium]|nr:radical SAM protein [candidate division Zixibacteria bacterium]
MTTVTLVYPYFHPSGDNSIFRFPPLGLGYIAAYLKAHGVSTLLVDCTFADEEKALERIRHSRPRIIGVQVMFSMKEKALEFARLLRRDCEFLVAGGPLPTSNPEEFVSCFDVVVVGEGEQTMLELVQAVQEGTGFAGVSGIAFKEKGEVIFTTPRSFIEDLDSVPFPSREMFDNDAYKLYYMKNFGYSTTSVMTSRGCPFKCDFCSRPVFGNRFRSRTAANVADEVELVRGLGYERVWFADDCFTLNRKRLLSICNELIRRGMHVGWECLSRVDTVDLPVAEKMKKAGCVRVFFGLESGNDSILKIMNKQATVKQAEDAVNVFRKAGVQTGAFFILGYPGESDRTVLDTVDFASSLPLDYLSFTFPYPIPGTPLFERVKDRMICEDWKEPDGFHLIKHRLLFRSSFSENKLKFAVFKGMAQFYVRKYLGKRGYRLLGSPFERVTDAVYGMVP